MNSQTPIGTQVPAASPALVPAVSTGQGKHNGGHRIRYRNRNTINARSPQCFLTSRLFHQIAKTGVKIF